MVCIVCLEQSFRKINVKVMSVTCILQGYGCFSGFIMSMYVMYLLSQRKLNIHMSSYQVMRNTLLKLCKYTFS